MHVTQHDQAQATSFPTAPAVSWVISRETQVCSLVADEKLPTIMYKPGDTLKGLGGQGGEGQRYEVHDFWASRMDTGHCQ